jgi:hypothetical protein
MAAFLEGGFPAVEGGILNKKIPRLKKRSFAGVVPGGHDGKVRNFGGFIRRIHAVSCYCCKCVSAVNAVKYR